MLGLTAAWLAPAAALLAVETGSGIACSVTRSSHGGPIISPTPKRPRPAGRTLWFLAVAVVVLVGVAVPYGLLAGQESGLAVVAFWLLFGLFVIGLVVIGVFRWKDDP